MQATMDPKTMPRADLEAEVVTLRRRDALCGFQGDALRRIGDIAAQATATATGQLSGDRLVQFRNRIVDLSRTAIDAIVRISDVGKDAVVAAAKAMCRLAMEIANYIYDHLGEIVAYAAIAVGVCLVVFDIVLLAGAALTYAGVVAAPVAGAATVVLDFERIHDLIGF